MTTNEQDTDDAQYRAKCRTACGIAGGLANKLSRDEFQLDPVDIAGAFAGTAVNVLVNAIGKSAAVAYLRDLAADLERDVDPSTTLN